MKRVLSPSNLLLATLLFAVNAALNVPLFHAGEMPYRDSIEGGYASMTRFFFDHPNPWGWNPLQYGGLPTQFIYLPGVQYLSALLAHLSPVEPTYLYRILVASLACLGPSTGFLFLVYFIRSRWWALGAMAAYTLCSPLYGIVSTIDRDRAIAQLPWRLLVLAKYGEGPHNAGLALLPVALVALWGAATSRVSWKLFAAAVLCAAIALTNWVAALALAFCVLTLALAAFGVPEFRFSRVVLCGLLAYGLACFWLTPTFISTIAFNWPADAFNYHLERQQTLLLWGLAAGLIVIRVVFAWLFPKDTFACFVVLNTFGFGWLVLWFYGRGLNTIPESRRYALEFELFLVVALFEYFRLVLRRPRPVAWFCVLVPAVCLVAAGWNQTRRYTTQGFSARNPVPVEQTIEYRLARKLAELKPEGRVFVSGGLRFRLNSWFPIAQVGGGFESGLKDRTPVVLADRIRATASGEEAIRDLRALGVEYVVVHGEGSREHYRDFKHPKKFERLLEVAHREEDDTIYRVPRDPALQVKIAYDNGTIEQYVLGAVSGVVWLSTIVWLVRTWKHESRVQRTRGVHAG